MRKTVVFMLLATATHLLMPLGVSAEKTTPKKATSSQEISNQNSPAEIFEVVRIEMGKKDYESAADAYMIALAFGAYDSKRVDHENADHSIRVLKKMLPFLFSKDEMAKLLESHNALLKKKEYVRDRLQELGPPAYSPDLVISAAKSVSPDTRNKKIGEPKGFNKKQAWNQTIEEILE